MRATLLLCLLSAGCALSPSAREDAALRPAALVDAYLVAHGMAFSYANSPEANPDVVLQLARLDLQAQRAVRAQDTGATADAIAALTDYAARRPPPAHPTRPTPEKQERVDTGRPALSGLSLRGITVLRGKRIVLEDVSLSAPPGEITAVLGGAGAGKTSLLAAVAGLLKLERGAVLRGGEDVSRLAPRRRGVAFLAPGSALPEALTVLAALRRMAGRTALPLLEDVQAALGLETVAHAEAGRLSHGQALLALAAARLAVKGDVLLVDEAGAGLGFAACDRLMAALRQRASAGATVLLATRSADVALAADHLVLLGDGRLLQAGTPASLYAEPRDAACARLTGRANILGGQIRELRAGGFVWSGGGRFLQAAAADAPRPALGGRVVLCLRPERLVLLGAEESRDNEQEGVVSEVISAGGSLLVRVVAGVGTLVVGVPSWPTVGYPARGQAVRVGWAADAGRLLVEG